MNVRTTSALRELNTVTALIGRSDASSSVMGVACALAAAVIMVLEWNQSKAGGSSALLYTRECTAPVNDSSTVITDK